MSHTYTESVTLSLLTCGGCGIAYGVPDTWLAERRTDHKTFNCPNGCSRAFQGKTEVEKLREQLQRTESRVTHWQDQAEAAERSARAQRGINTKLRQRIANGICPCCHRSFVNLAKHMSGQHPDYIDKGAE